MHICLGFPTRGLALLCQLCDESKRASNGFRPPSGHPMGSGHQAGIQWVQATKSSLSSTIKLPITLVCLDKLSEHWETTAQLSRLPLWAVSSRCFAGFFCQDELLPALGTQAAIRTCTQWGDVTVDNTHTMSMVQMHLQTSIYKNRNAISLAKGWMYSWWNWQPTLPHCSSGGIHCSQRIQPRSGLPWL